MIIYPIQAIANRCMCLPMSTKFTKMEKQESYLLDILEFINADNDLYASLSLAICCGKSNISS